MVTDLCTLELTSAITAVANTLACRLTASEITLLDRALVQPNDTLTTIGTVKYLCEGDRTKQVKGTLQAKEVFLLPLFCIKFKQKRMFYQKETASALKKVTKNGIIC